MCARTCVCVRVCEWWCPRPATLQTGGAVPGEHRAHTQRSWGSSGSRAAWGVAHLSTHGAREADFRWGTLERSRPRVSACGCAESVRGSPQGVQVSEPDPELAARFRTPRGYSTPGRPPPSQRQPRLWPWPWPLLNRDGVGPPYPSCLSPDCCYSHVECPLSLCPVRQIWHSGSSTHHCSGLSFYESLVPIRVPTEAHLTSTFLQCKSCSKKRKSTGWCGSVD